MKKIIQKELFHANQLRMLSTNTHSVILRTQCMCTMSASRISHLFRKTKQTMNVQILSQNAPEGMDLQCKGGNKLKCTNRIDMEHLFLTEEELLVFQLFSENWTNLCMPKVFFSD